MISKYKVDDIAPLFSVNQVANIFHVHPSTLRRWSDQGLIRSFRLNSHGDRRYRKFDVYHFIPKLRRPTANPYKSSG